MLPYIGLLPLLLSPDMPSKQRGRVPALSDVLVAELGDNVAKQPYLIVGLVLAASNSMLMICSYELRPMKSSYTNPSIQTITARRPSHRLRYASGRYLSPSTAETMKQNKTLLGGCPCGSSLI